ncbi:FAD-dependent monooxygenase, partial [Pseudomonas aeruginosa]
LGVRATGYLPPAAGEGATLLSSDRRKAHAHALIAPDGFNPAIRPPMPGPARPTAWHYVIWRATPPFRHPQVTPAWRAR